jgi:hypothetical protein
MIKLFGWQHLVQQRVNAKRMEEMKFVWHSRMLDMSINVVRCVLMLLLPTPLIQWRGSNLIPSVQSAVTFAMYTLVFRKTLTGKHTTQIHPAALLMLFPASTLFSSLLGPSAIQNYQ